MQPVDGFDGGPDRTERRIGSEYHVVATEEIEPAAQRILAAEQRGVAVEVVEVIEMRPLERRQDLRIVLVGGAAAEHVQSRPDAPVVIRDHAAEMMRDDLDAGMT